MYYSDETVEEVLRANDIVDVVSSYVHLKRSGANYFGLCPFHSEKSPSFSVSPAKQMYYCFGCGAGGNAATFLMKYENCGFQEALQSLADRAGIKLPSPQLSEETRKKEERRAQLLSVNKESATYYYKLLRSPKGRRGYEYFLSRGLDAATMNAFGLGYADGSSNDLVRYLREKGFPDEIILEAGVAAFDEKRGLHDKFWNRVMYPIMDVTNKVIGFGGRVMGEGKPKYLNSPETPVFDKSRNLYGLNIARKSRKPYLIVCEGYMDVISMHQAGFPEAIASLGTSFTAGQAALISRYVKEVLLAYDSDEAGVRAALRNIGILKEAGLRARVIDLRPYKDPDEFMKALGREEFQKRIDDAENSFFYEIRQMEPAYRMDDPAQKTEFYRQIAKKLCGFEEEMERESYLRSAAARYLIPEDLLRRQVASYNLVGGESSAPVPERRTPGAAGARNSVNEAFRRKQRLLLTWISDDPELYPQIRPYIGAQNFDEGIYRTAAARYFEQLEQAYGPDTSEEQRQHIRFTPAAVIAAFDEEEEQKEAASLFEERLQGVESPQEKEKALLDVLLSLKQEQIQQLFGESGDPQALGKLIAAKKELEQLKKCRFTIR